MGLGSECWAVQVGGAHLPPVALWVAEELYKYFPSQVTQEECWCWSWAEGVCPSTLELDSLAQNKASIN